MHASKVFCALHSEADFYSLGQRCMKNDLEPFLLRDMDFKVSMKSTKRT